MTCACQKTIAAGPSGLGTVPHWGLIARPRGLGAAASDPTDPVFSSAAALLSYFGSNAPDKGSHPVVSAFQTAYNNSGQPGVVTVDGQYGANSQRALQNTLDLAQSLAGPGPSQTAPANAWGKPMPAVPGVDVTPPGGGGGGGSGGGVTPPAPAPTKPMQAGMLGLSPTAWLIAGGVAVVAVAAGVATHRKPRMHHHRR